MTKRYLFPVLIFGLTVLLQEVKAQLIYFSDSQAKLFTVDIAGGGCAVQLLGQMQYNNNPFTATDMAFHPNGKLYAIDGVGLYTVNLASLNVTLVGSLNIGGGDFVNSLVCDSDGVLYTADTQLFTLDINTGNATSIGFLPCESSGDLAFNNDELYLACVENKLLKINIDSPLASQIVGTMMASDPFFGIVTVATECSEIQTFGTAGSGLYEIDISNANSNFLCNLSGAEEVYGAAMETDFIASDCEIILDLDEDNSSGATGPDFFSDTICGNFETPIADLSGFIAIAPNLIVDSMVFDIAAGQLDGNAEQLILNPISSNMDIIGSGTNHITLVNPNGLLNADIIHPLENARYLNTAMPFTPGVREITVQIFAEETESDVATAYVYLITPESYTFDFGPDTTLCEGETLLLDASYEGAVAYEWNGGMTSPALTVESDGTYAVTVTNDCGGTTTDEITVDFVPPLQALDLGPDTTLCPGASLSVDASIIDGMNYEWNTGATTPTLTITETGLYEVSVTSGCGIQTSDILVTFEEVPSISLFPEDTLMCQDEVLLLDATFPNALAYNWQDGSTESMLTVSEAGNYNVEVTFQCGTYTDEIYVRYNDYDLTVDLGPDTTFCYGDTVVLDVSSPYTDDYLWQDGAREGEFIVRNTGVYNVTLSDGCTEVDDQVFLRMISCCNVFVPNIFSPNFDGINDDLKPFSNCEFPAYEFKVFNRWGALVFQTDDQRAAWDGTFKGAEGQEGVYVWLLEYNDGIEDQVLGGDVTLVR